MLLLYESFSNQQFYRLDVPQVCAESENWTVGFGLPVCLKKRESCDIHC